LTISFNLPDFGDIRAKLNVVFMKGTKIGASFVSIDETSRKVINNYLDKYASTNLRKFFR
jgi:low affinity Fe/Cu permease